MSLMSNRRGFTLVEVVLSLAIVAMVVAAVFAVLRLAHRAEQKGSARTEANQRVLILSDRLTWLIAGAYPLSLPDSEDESESLLFEGESDSVAFVTTSLDTYSDSPADRPGLKYVRIVLAPEGLVVEERMFYMQEAEPDVFVLEPNATSLEIEYLEQDSESGETEWVGNWDPETREYMPLAVNVRIVLKLDGRDVSVPPMIIRLPAGGELGVPIPFPAQVARDR